MAAHRPDAGTRASIVFFMMLATVCAVGALWNPAQLFASAICLGLARAGIRELENNNL